MTRIESIKCNHCGVIINPKEDAFVNIRISISDEKKYENQTAAIPWPDPISGTLGAHVIIFDLCSKCFENIEWKK